MKNTLGFHSLCAQELPDKRTTTPHNLPIYATSSFNFETIEQGIDVFSGKSEGHIYGRFANPTIDAAAEKLAQLESCGQDFEAMTYLFSSGMAAISAVFVGLLKSGDKVLTQPNIYGGTTSLMRDILAPLGIETVYADLRDSNKVEHFLYNDPAIQMVYLETPTNPTLDCVDIVATANLTKQYTKWLVVDNTFATPYLQQPLALGADFVVHSTTKYLNGQGNSVAGAVVGKDVDVMQERIWKVMKFMGGNCNAWDAWLTYNGMKTLALRMKQHSANALQVARTLARHEKVKHINYIGLDTHPDHSLAKQQMRDFGGMLSFELKGGLEAGKTFMNHLQFCTIAPTLGDMDTLVLHPASMSHIGVAREVRIASGITDGLIRISVGIENAEDILVDVMTALSAS
ncbi:MAG: PLP-dependent aspartate aminotransferase family protein [Bacteroidota bacterium]